MVVPHQQPPPPPRSPHSTRPIRTSRVPPPLPPLIISPQVDLLKAGVAVFLTHGGQNSFMESLMNATPMVVCPTAGDQFDNARLAVDLGVGLDAGRPDPDPGSEAAAAAAYRAHVAAQLRAVLPPDAPYRAAAARLQERLRCAGGVARAAEMVRDFVAAGQGSP